MNKRSPRKKILIIDDDKDFCEELSDILSGEGYLVDCENDGISGQVKLDKSSYDILLLDIKLPGLDGETILQELRKGGSAPKVIVITGSPLHRRPSGTEKEITGLPYPLALADKVIIKPFEIPELIKAIDLVLR